MKSIESITSSILSLYIRWDVATSVTSALLILSFCFSSSLSHSNNKGPFPIALYILAIL